MAESDWTVLVSFAGNTGHGSEGEELAPEFRNSPDVKDWRRAGFLPRLEQAKPKRRRRKKSGSGSKADAKSVEERGSQKAPSSE